MEEELPVEDVLLEQIPLGELTQEGFFANDPTVVLGVDFLQNEFCTSFETMSIIDFGACSSYISLELFISYLSLALGLVLGYILAKAVADSWS